MPEEPKTIQALIQSDHFKNSVAAVLPHHLTPTRFLRILASAATRVPKLMECDPISFAQCCMQLSQFGLEPDGRHAHLIPFWNSKNNSFDCQLIIDYKGLANLAMRSGFVSFVHADKICENDVFEYDKGIVTKHQINFKEDRGKAYAYYAMVRFKDGAEKADVMTMAEVNAIRARSKAKDSGPWTTDFDEMGKKTVFRRLSKWLPLSAEYRDAVDLDTDALDELRFETAKPLIRRAQVPKILPVPVLVEPESETNKSLLRENHECVSGEARESTRRTSAGDAPKGVMSADSRGGQDSEKKTTLKKKRGRPSSNLAEIVLPNLAAITVRLKVGGYSSDQLMQVARNNEWVLETQSWPLPEETLTKFLDEENWSTIESELEALPRHTKD